MGRGTLPRVSHADRPRSDETIYKNTGSDLQNGWLSRHGDLILTEERLLFLPTVLDTALRAKRREVPLGEITEIERFPADPAEPAPGAKRPRLRIHTDACVYELIVGDLDAWIDAIQRVYEIRAKGGRPYMPRITRENYVNLLREDRFS